MEYTKLIKYGDHTRSNLERLAMSLGMAGNHNKAIRHVIDNYGDLAKRATNAERRLRELERENADLMDGLVRLDRALLWAASIVSKKENPKQEEEE